VNDFIKSNDFYSLNKDRTNSCQRNIRHFVNNNTSLIRKEHKWKLINMNQIPPNLRGVIKAHKPVVNWQNAPQSSQFYYFLSQYIYISLFNFKNTIVHDLKAIPVNLSTVQSFLWYMECVYTYPQWLINPHHRHKTQKYFVDIT
jgi:hypothetical protein